MSNELIELCQKYELKLADMNKVYWFLANNQIDEAIRYLNPLVGYDRQVAIKIVELYNVSEQEQIEDGRQRIQNVVKQEFEVKNKPKCPICQSTSLSKITTTSKAVKIAAFGIFGMGDNGKTWKCNHCGSKF